MYVYIKIQNVLKKSIYSRHQTVRSLNLQGGKKITLVFSYFLKKKRKSVPICVVSSLKNLQKGADYSLFQSDVLYYYFRDT